MELDIEQIIEEMVNGDMWFTVLDLPEGTDENLEEVPNV